MADRTNNSIELPPEVQAAAEEYAKIVRKPLPVVIEEALRFYFDADPEQNALRKSVKDEAASLGLTPEEYAQHIVDESRAEWRKPITLPDELLKRARP